MRLSIIATLLLLFPEVLSAQLHLPKWATNEAASNEKLLRGISDADDPGTVQAAYRTLFKKLGPDGVHELLTHRNDSIALRAAWEEVNLTLPVKEPGEVLVVDRHKLDWFVGYLEGRVRVRAPEWWKEAMLGSKANRRDNVYPAIHERPFYHDTAVDFAKAPSGTTLVRTDGKLNLRIGTDAAVLPDEILRKDDAGKLSDNITALFTPSRCYVALHDDVGYPYQLVCIDRSSGHLKWKADAWGSYIGGASGPFSSRVAILEQDERVFVFGVATTGFHVEGFRSKDGSNLFRVSNSF
jgi:hypothetical protein